MKTSHCRECGSLKAKGDRICSGCGAGSGMRKLRRPRSHTLPIAAKQHGFHALNSRGR